jgi:hypothetical protein
MIQIARVKSKQTPGANQLGAYPSAAPGQLEKITKSEPFYSKWGAHAPSRAVFGASPNTTTN